MSIFDAILMGALGMATMILVIVAGVVAVFRVWPKLVELTDGFTGLVKAVRGVPETLAGIREELAFMRGLTQQQQQIAATGGDSFAGYGGPVGSADKPAEPVRFPSPAWDRFAEAKDIPDDTLDPGQIELLEQTDAELVEMERLEAVRKRSGIVEDSDAKHEAIIAESE